MAVPAISEPAAGAIGSRFPFTKWTQFRSLESRQRQLVDARRLRSTYLENFNNFCRQLQTQARQIQVDYHLMRTDEPVERALGIYLTTRHGSL